MCSALGLHMADPHLIPDGSLSFSVQYSVTFWVQNAEQVLITARHGPSKMTFLIIILISLLSFLECHRNPYLFTLKRSFSCPLILHLQLIAELIWHILLSWIWCTYVSNIWAFWCVFFLISIQCLQQNLSCNKLLLNICLLILVGCFTWYLATRFFCDLQMILLIWLYHSSFIILIFEKLTLNDETFRYRQD